MSNIPAGTRFIGISPTVNLKERKSALINAETQPYTLEDISGSSGSPIFYPDIISYTGTTCADITVIEGEYSTNILGSREITAPNLVTINGQIYLNGNSLSSLQTINLPLVQTISVYSKATVPNWDDASIKISSYPILDTINFGSLTRVDGYIQISNIDILTSIDLSTLQIYNSDSSFYISYNPLLTSIDISGLTTFDADVQFTGNALTQASIDAILYQLAEVVNLANQQVDLSGGTNAAPSVTGQGYVTTLTNNGCTVLTN